MCSSFRCEGNFRTFLKYFLKYFPAQFFQNFVDDERDESNASTVCDERQKHLLLHDAAIKKFECESGLNDKRCSETIALYGFAGKYLLRLAGDQNPSDGPN